MSRETKDKAVRFRVTPSEDKRHIAAAQKLGITEMSIFYRWALENSTVAVLGTTIEGTVLPAQPQAQPKPKAAPKPKREALKLPGFDENPFFSPVSEPVDFVPPPPSAPRAEMPPELQQLLGVPLYGPAPGDARPVPFDDDFEA